MSQIWLDKGQSKRFIEFFIANQKASNIAQDEVVIKERKANNIQKFFLLF